MTIFFSRLIISLCVPASLRETSFRPLEGNTVTVPGHCLGNVFSAPVAYFQAPPIHVIAAGSTAYLLLVLPEDRQWRGDSPRITFSRAK